MSKKNVQKLSYMAESGYVPIPPAEKDLQTVTANFWFKVSDEFKQLEGLCFDREGNLYLLEVFGGSIMKIELATMKIREIYKAEAMNPAAIKIHKDGRLFICCLGDFKKGLVFAITPDGNNYETIVPTDAGHVVDDMVFDSKGGFYFTDFVGESCNPTGGVYYVSPDFKTITPVMKNMSGPNGIALSTNERVLWVTETNANRLHLIELEDDGLTIPPFGTCIPYRFTGYLGPDSCCIDSEDNLYVAMYNQGRVMVFNRHGFPIGQVLIPGRESGHNLRTTHPMLIPGTDDLLICTNDWTNGEGAQIFIAKGFAKAHRGFQFR